MIIPFKPYLYIWIDVEVEKCLERIKIRGRLGEENISVKYLDRLFHSYVRFMEGLKNVYVLDNNINEKILELIEPIISSSRINIAIEGIPGSGTSLDSRYRHAW